MSYRIRCYTLFNIKNTGVTGRRIPDNLSDDEKSKYTKARNCQLNFDTILQVISMRGQPENISDVSMETINFTEFGKFGFLYDTDEVQQCYNFEFTVPFGNVFNDGVDELGALLSDCDGVPVIKVDGEYDKFPSFLDISPELRNVFFEVVNERE